MLLVLKSRTCLGGITFCFTFYGMSSSLVLEMFRKTKLGVSGCLSFGVASRTCKYFSPFFPVPRN